MKLHDLYTGAYVQKTLNQIHTEWPDLRRAGKYREIVQTLRSANLTGGNRAAEAAWKQLIKQQPELADLIADHSDWQFTPASDLDDLDLPEWITPGMVPEKRLCALRGSRGSGQSLIALLIALTAGEQHSVIYIATKGQSSYPGRVQAWEQATGKKARLVSFGFDVLNLLDTDRVHEFIVTTAAYCPALIVIDTLADCLIGGDETNLKDMSLAVKACDTIRQMLGASVLLVQHSDPDSAGGRFLYDSCFSVIEVTDHDGLLTVSSGKLRDGKPFKDYQINMAEFDDSTARLADTEDD